MTEAELNREFDAGYRKYVRGLEDEVVKLRAEVRDLRGRLEVCIAKYGPGCYIQRARQTDWRVLLRQSGYRRNASTLKKIYKIACKKNNMSCIRQNHGLYFVAQGDPAIEIEPGVLETDVGFQQEMFFDFSRLVRTYPEIVVKIAKLVMVKHREISVVARFDIHDAYPPIQGGLDPRSGLSYRFHWGGKACAINSSPLPNNVLAPIFVSRAWHDIFGTAFYGLNTFSFESLGEFFIFCQRTPVARRQRIRAISLSWIGSIMETSNPNKRGLRWCKSRWGLHKLDEFVSLQSLEISLDETSKGRMRRIRGPKWAKNPLLRSTRDHENYRKYRDLRKLRGADNIYQLRGLNHVEVFDSNSDYPRTRVRDQTFVEDIRRQVCLKKSDQDMERSRLENLKPLLRRSNGLPLWVPPEQVRYILQKIFDTPIPHPLPCWPEDEYAIVIGDGSDSGDGNDVAAENDNQNGNQNPKDGNDGSESDNDSEGEGEEDDDDDDAPDIGAAVCRETPLVVENRNLGSNEENNQCHRDDSSENCRDAERLCNISGITSDDGGMEFTNTQMRSSSLIETEEDNKLGFVSSFTHSGRIIDLANMPETHNPDFILPSIEMDVNMEEAQAKDKIKVASVTSAESKIGSMDGISSFEPKSSAHLPIKGEYLNNESSVLLEQVPSQGTQRGYSSLFVSQSPSPRRSIIDRDVRRLSRLISDRKRSFDDAEIYTVVPTTSWEVLIGATWNFSVVDEDRSSKRCRMSSVVDGDVKKE